jgi:hypothetical protein
MQEMRSPVERFTTCLHRTQTSACRESVSSQFAVLCTRVGDPRLLHATITRKNSRGRRAKSALLDASSRIPTYLEMHPSHTNTITNSSKTCWLEKLRGDASGRSRKSFGGKSDLGCRRQKTPRMSIPHHIYVCKTGKRIIHHLSTVISLTTLAGLEPTPPKGIDF